MIHPNLSPSETPRKNKHPASPSRNRGMGVIKKRITNESDVFDFDYLDKVWVSVYLSMRREPM